MVKTILNRGNKMAYPGFIKFFYTIIRLLATTAVVVLYVHYFFPQSWGFYTIESNLPLYNIYYVRNGIADKIPAIRNNMSYGMGVSRKGKILFNELYEIIENKNFLWKQLNVDSLNYITQHGIYILIPPGSEYAFFKGKFLITKTQRPSYLILKKGERFQPTKEYILAGIR